MALIDRIDRHRREIRRTYEEVSEEEFARLLGQSTGSVIRTKAGNSVGVMRVLGITAWYSGVRYIAETVSMLPWKHYLKLPDDSRERRAPWSWLAKPDVEQTWAGWAEHTVMSLLHKGNAFSFKVRDPFTAQVVGLRELNCDRVTGGCAPDGTKRFMVDRDPTVYTTREILHIPGIAYNGRYGLNPIATLADALGAVAAADDYAARFFASSTHLGGLISVPEQLNSTQAKELREEWDRFHQGLLNAHKTGVLSKGATYTPLSLNARDTQLIESRILGITEISRALRIPPHKLYELTRSTNNNIEQQSIESTTDSIRPWAQRIENAINADPDLVQSPHYIEAELEGVLRGDSASRAAFYTSGVNGGWMTPAHVARLENLPAGPELEYYLRPLNMDVIHPGAETVANEPDARNLSAAEVLQKIYLAVQAGLITVEEARQMAIAAGAVFPAAPPLALTAGGTP